MPGGGWRPGRRHLRSRMALPPPGPERDRQIAAKPRYGARKAAAVGDIAESFMASDAVKRMRRFHKVAGALRATFSPEVLGKLTPISCTAGVLTLAVADGTLLAELRQHHAHELRDALAKAGTGVSQIVWRLAKTRFRGRAGEGKR